jgi:hypothetical protein
MKKSLMLLLLILGMLNFSACHTSSGGGGGGGGGYYDDGDSWDDSWDDDWYDDDDWYNDDDGGSSDDGGWDDGGDDWGDDDGGWDDNDDGCWDCGDDWGWYDENQRQNGSHSTDIMGDVSDKEKAKLKRASEFYANKFNLSADQGLKIAKTMQDFKALEKRTATDLAEFAQKLYGLNPEEILTSVGSAQVGDHSKLDQAIEKAASNFNTTSENMKTIIRDLHGKALKDNGIEL